MSTRARYEHEEHETHDLFPKLTSTKEATSPLRCSQRAGLPSNPFPHPINHLGRLSLLLVMSTKDGVIQTSRGAHTREGDPRVTPNRLEASFKSNKRESTNGDGSSAVEMNLAALTSQKLKPTLILLTPKP